MVDGWEAGRGRVDPGLIPRMCAWRPVLALADAVEALRELHAWADVRQAPLGPDATHLREWMHAAHARVADALNAMAVFGGPSRPTSVDEVEAMGALLGVEELDARGVPRVLVVRGGGAGHRAALVQELGRRLRLPVAELPLLVAGAVARCRASGRLGNDADVAAFISREAPVHGPRGFGYAVDDEDAPTAWAFERGGPVGAALAGWLAGQAGTSGMVVDAGDGGVDAPDGALRFCLARDAVDVGEVPLADGASVPQHLRAILGHVVPEPSIPARPGLSGRPLLFA